MTTDFIYVIGNNEYGELGVNGCEDITSLTYAPYNLVKQIKNMHCGYQYTIFSDLKHQRFWSAGWNEHGQCAIQNNDKCITEVTPIQYFNDMNIPIVKICSNISGCSTFWITGNNRLYAHGLNEHYQLGVGDDKNRNKPILIDDLTFVNDVKSTSQYSIALCTKGIDIIISGWSALLSTKHFPSEIIDLIISFYGNSTEVYMVPYNMNAWCKIPVFNNTRTIKIDSGRYHSIFLQSDGSLWSFGDNAQHQLGVKEIKKVQKAKRLRIPMLINSITKVKEIACGWYHNLIITMEHQIYAWGYNNYGQCGDFNMKTVKIPTLIPSLKKNKIISIVCGAYHSGAITIYNECFLFGSNIFCECVVRGQREAVPTLINNALPGEGRQNKFIKGMYLGYHNTKLIVCNR